LELRIKGTEVFDSSLDQRPVPLILFKPSGYAKDHEEPLGDHFPLFATFRLK
jgi:hypothetical protein